jgi:hypothetical protein
MCLACGTCHGSVKSIGLASSIDKQVQRTMLELINQLDGFDPRGNIKVRPVPLTHVSRITRLVPTQCGPLES